MAAGQTAPAGLQLQDDVCPERLIQCVPMTIFLAQYCVTLPLPLFTFHSCPYIDSTFPIPRYIPTFVDNSQPTPAATHIPDR